MASTLSNGKKESMSAWRFENLEGDSHRHHLQSTRSKHKFSGILRFLIGSRKKGKGREDSESAYLLCPSMDQLESKRSRIPSEKNPNATASLVEKYGNCQDCIGRGAYGIVYLCHKADPKNGDMENIYAIKKLRLAQVKLKRYRKQLTAEFCILSSLQHPNVIRSLDLLHDATGNLCEVMEFCAGGDLHTLISSTGKLEILEADCFFKQLVRGVQYIHEMGVAHQDLKPENLLLTTSGALKIADFGAAECFRMAWEKEAHMATGIRGSKPYIAPEVFTGTEFDPRAVDLWACGVIYMVMRTGELPWRIAKKGHDSTFDGYLDDRKRVDGYQPIEILHKVLARIIPYVMVDIANYSHLKARFQDVIYSILNPIPIRRFTASQVLKSRWGGEITLCSAAESGA